MHLKVCHTFQLTCGLIKKLGNLPKVIKINKSYSLNYLAGLVDTDGSIYGKRIQLKQKRYNLIKEIEKLSKEFSLHCSSPKINYTNEIPFYYIRFDNKLPLRLKKVFKPLVSNKIKPL